MSDIDIAVVDSLKVLDPKRPIREADIARQHRSSPIYEYTALDSRRARIKKLTEDKDDERQQETRCLPADDRFLGYLHKVSSTS